MCGEVVSGGFLGAFVLRFLTHVLFAFGSWDDSFLEAAARLFDWNRNLYQHVDAATGRVSTRAMWPVAVTFLALWACGMAHYTNVYSLLLRADKKISPAPLSTGEIWSVVSRAGGLSGVEEFLALPTKSGKLNAAVMRLVSSQIHTLALLGAFICAQKAAAVLAISLAAVPLYCCLLLVCEVRPCLVDELRDVLDEKKL